MMSMIFMLQIAKNVPLGLNNEVLPSLFYVTFQKVKEIITCVFFIADGNATSHFILLIRI